MRWRRVQQKTPRKKIGEISYFQKKFYRWHHSSYGMPVDGGPYILLLKKTFNFKAPFGANDTQPQKADWFEFRKTSRISLFRQSAKMINWVTTKAYTAYLFSRTGNRTRNPNSELPIYEESICIEILRIDEVGLRKYLMQLFVSFYSKPLMLLPAPMQVGTSFFQLFLYFLCLEMFHFSIGFSLYTFYY